MGRRRRDGRPRKRYHGFVRCRTRCSCGCAQRCSESVNHTGPHTYPHPEGHRKDRGLWRHVTSLPSDYTGFARCANGDAGQVVRWSDPARNDADCSCGCRWAAWLDDVPGDWLICTSPRASRSGLLTFEHMTGHGCFEAGAELMRASLKAERVLLIATCRACGRVMTETMGKLPSLTMPWSWEPDTAAPNGWTLAGGQLACSEPCAQKITEQLVTCDMCLESEWLIVALAEGWQNPHSSVWICPDDLE